jgi:hypothetical protein
VKPPERAQENLLAGVASVLVIPGQGQGQTEEPMLISTHHLFEAGLFAGQKTLEGFLVLAVRGGESG